MDSRGWNAGLGLLAAGLAALLIADLAGSSAKPDPGARIVPEWDVRKVLAVRIERGGEAPVVIERGKVAAARAPGAGTGAGSRSASASGSGSGSGTGTGTGTGSGSGSGDNDWVLRFPGPSEGRVPADPAAVRELFGTIEMLSAIRRDSGGTGRARMTLVIEREGGPAVQLLLGEAGPGPTDRLWLARADRDGRFLIDGYAARALDVGAEELREHRPFRGRTFGASRIEIGAGASSTVLTGPPWRVELPGGAARADALAVQGLLDQLEQLRLAEFANRPEQTPSRLLAVDGRAGHSELTQYGTCAGGATLVDTPAGSGCTTLPPPLKDAGSDPRRLVDRSLVSARIDDVIRLRLQRGGRTTDVERAQSPDALRAWLARWRGAAAGPLEPAGSAPALATIEVEVEGGLQERIAIARTEDGRLAARRGDEPVALVLHAWADELIDPAPYRFRALDLLSYEPSALRAAAARRASRVVGAVERGETLEEWRTQAGAAVPLATAERLRQAVGFLRAERFAAPLARAVHGLSPPRRTIELLFDPPPGGAEPLRHTLEIGAATAGGRCFARLDRDPAVFELSAERCAAVLGPWAGQ